ncbi:facilitated trehalose transporter Tret1-like [Epargyreus clarus]|uniref:facilitated trehalose transporter Tret1-like n=1 Tax=Epargyreus clarus TaxID=520877 RepID=UPI003C2CC773
MVFTISSKNLEITQDVPKGCVWKQYFLSFMLSFPFFTQGVQTTSLSASAHSGHFSIPDDVPWSTTALIVGTICSAPVHCYIIDKWGRKFGFYVVIMLQGISCIPLLLSPNEITVIMLHILAGITSGGLFTVLPIYIREICADEIRASMVALMALMTSAGYLVELVMTDETLLYVMAGLVLFQFLAVFLTIETPSYLVIKNKLEVATENLAKLKCVDGDNQLVIEQVSKLKDESERAKMNGTNVLKIYRNKIWLDATKIGLVLYTVMVFSGSIVFLDQEKTLQQLETTADPDRILVPVCLSAGGITTVIFMRFLERKYYLTFAYSTMVLSMGTLAVYTQADLTVTEFRWVPIVCLAILVFSYGMAWSIPAVIMVEILNIEIRSKTLGIIYTYSQILKLIHVHTFQYLKESIGVYTLLYIFSCVNLFGAVYTISKVPDIKLKTVRQVERQLKRIPILK